jgi:hypothetical protein
MIVYREVSHGKVMDMRTDKGIMEGTINALLELELQTIDHANAMQYPKGACTPYQLALS